MDNPGINLSTWLLCIFSSGQTRYSWIMKHGLYLVKFDCENQHQSIPQTIRILTKVFCIFCPNLVILAWMGHKLSHRQAQHRMMRIKFGIEPIWCWDRNIPGEAGQNYGYWWPGFFGHQVISSHRSLLSVWGKKSNFCNISVMTHDRKFKHIFVSSKQFNSQRVNSEGTE